MITVEGTRSIIVATSARIIEDAHDCAWAEKKIYHNPGYKWIFGKYVEADNANSNKQYWSLTDLRKSHKTVRNAPLNLLHRPRAVVGTFVDAELVYPTDDEVAYVTNPFVEALAVYWHYYFQEEFAEIDEAHKAGQLFFSMECVADTITEMWDDGNEGETFKYMGPRHESYSAAINEGECARRFNNTRFLGGALIVPPEKPGWKSAEVKEISRYLQEKIDRGPDKAQEVEDPEGESEDKIEVELELSPDQWAALMELLCKMGS